MPSYIEEAKLSTKGAKVYIVCMDTVLGTPDFISFESTLDNTGHLALDVLVKGQMWSGEVEEEGSTSMEGSSLAKIVSKNNSPVLRLPGRPEVIAGLQCHSNRTGH